MLSDLQCKCGSGGSEGNDVYGYLKNTGASACFMVPLIADMNNDTLNAVYVHS